MTLEQLQAKRDDILRTAGLASVESSGGASAAFSVDKQKELALIDAEIARLTGTARIRQVRLYGSKGL